MRGYVQPLPDGKYRIFIEAPRDAITGRRDRLTETFKGTRKEADARCATLVTQMEEGRAGAAPMTFGALIDRWLEHAEVTLADYTLDGYRDKLRNQIRPALGDVKLRKLTTDRLDALYRALLERGGKPRGRRRPDAPDPPPVPLSAQSVKHVHALIHAILEYACRNQWLDRNPATRAWVPPVDAYDEPPPSPAEVVAVADLLTDDMRELVLATVVVGPRRGEVCGLQWSDLVLDEGPDGGIVGGQLTIARALAEPKALRKLPVWWVVKTTKTRKTRRVAIDMDTAAMLQARRVRKAAEALKCGVPFARDGFMFAELPGGTEPLKPSLVTKRWANAARRAGVKARYQDLRHFAITELLEAGFEVGGVAKRHGHGSTKMTQDRYQHSRRSQDQAAAEHLSSLVRPG